MVRRLDSHGMIESNPNQFIEIRGIHNLSNEGEMRRRQLGTRPRAVWRLDLNTTAMWPFSLFFTPEWKVISKEKREERNALIQEAQRGLSTEATTDGDKYTRASGALWSLI